jgi:hypothetical protein
VGAGTSDDVADLAKWEVVMSAHTNTAWRRAEATDALQKAIDKKAGQVRRLDNKLDRMSYGPKWCIVEEQWLAAMTDLDALRQEQSRIHIGNTEAVF